MIAAKLPAPLAGAASGAGFLLVSAAVCQPETLMGEIIFEGAAPYEPLSAQSATTKPTIDGVELVLNVFVEGLPTETVPVRIQLEPEVARALASRLATEAMIVENWRKNL